MIGVEHGHESFTVTRLHDYDVENNNRWFV